jgi:hypothetical protein
VLAPEPLTVIAFVSLPPSELVRNGTFPNGQDLSPTEKETLLIFGEIRKSWISLSRKKRNPFLVLGGRFEKRIWSKAGFSWNSKARQLVDRFERASVPCTRPIFGSV